MKNYDSIIFDLDGTLWDACSACALGWSKALASLNIDKNISVKDIESICGLTYSEIMNKLFTDLDIEKLKLKETLSKYERIEVEKNGGALFEGVSTLIPKLKDKFNLYIVSNCQEWYLNAFLKHSGLKKHFIDWESHGRTNEPKYKNILSVVKRNKLKEPIYVGDTAGDLTAAEKAGVDFLYARFGFQKLKYEPSLNNFNEITNFLPFI